MTLLEISLLGGLAILGLITLLEATLTTTNPGYEYVEDTRTPVPWFPHKVHDGKELRQ